MLYHRVSAQRLGRGTHEGSSGTSIGRYWWLHATRAAHGTQQVEHQLVQVAARQACLV